MIRKDNNRIAIFLGHPAHYHMFKYVVANLEKRGMKVDFLVKRKDILEDLVKQSGHPYYIVRKQERQSSNKIKLILSLLSMEWHVTSYLIRHRPRLLIGTYAPIISHLVGIPVIVCCEDDTAVIPRFAKTSYPYAASILAPQYCDGGTWNSKMTKYAGFQKLAYLHPNYFTPCKDIITPFLRDPNRPFVLLRFAKLQAHHDEGIHGMSDTIASRLISILQPSYDIYISSERPLPNSLEPYRLQINPLDIHHWMYYASFYIGDSQSMAVEAAMLGTPSIRFSDFAQRIGVLNALEEKYHLTFGIPSNNPQKLFTTVQQLISTPNFNEEFRNRQQQMLNEQIDVTAFFTDFILNFPCTTLPHNPINTSSPS